jgi:hypothetical protein
MEVRGDGSEAMTTAGDTHTHQWVARTQALTPLIERHRDQSERDRRMAVSIFEAIPESGIPRGWRDLDLRSEPPGALLPRRIY